MLSNRACEVRWLGGSGACLPRKPFAFETTWDCFWCNFGVKQQGFDNFDLLLFVLDAFKGVAPLRPRFVIAIL